MTHIPVLMHEMAHYVLGNDLTTPFTILDGTFGEGGYSRFLLASHPMIQVIGCDRDESACHFGAILKRDYPDRFTMIQCRFDQFEEYFPGQKFDRIVFDFGVSSNQLDQGERGFSFQKEGPLDMRMGLCKRSAFEVVNYLPLPQLAHLIQTYGEEKRSLSVARAICTARQNTLIKTTLELTKIIHSVVPSQIGFDGATQTFQAIRMYVNDELAQIQSALEYSTLNLLPDGIVVCVSFHGLEDRLVKLAFQGPSFSPLTKKPVCPTHLEIKKNPRSRSGRLRAARIQ